MAEPLDLLRRAHRLLAHYRDDGLPAQLLASDIGEFLETQAADSRSPTAGGDPELRSRAIQAGAEERWVTADGYTQLPDIMLEALDLRGGGHVWFLPHKDRWEAWPEAELSQALGGDDSKEER